MWWENARSPSFFLLSHRVECGSNKAVSYFQRDDTGGRCNVIIRPPRHLMENLPVSSSSLEFSSSIIFPPHLHLSDVLYSFSPPGLSHRARWETGKGTQQQQQLTEGWEGVCVCVCVSVAWCTPLPSSSYSITAHNCVAGHSAASHNIYKGAHLCKDVQTHTLSAPPLSSPTWCIALTVLSTLSLLQSSLFSLLSLFDLFC